MTPAWFKPRKYKHLDAPVGLPFTKLADNASYVAKHSWSPLFFYVRRTKRYKVGLRKTVYKNRPIMYASHRDSCILSRYSVDLSELLDKVYESSQINDAVLAYRKLGRSNYDFAAVAIEFARELAPCVVHCFDITGFFDNLDHGIIKKNLKDLLKVRELPRDWYGVFRNVTKYRHVCLEELKSCAAIGPRFRDRRPGPVATIAELKAQGISIFLNSNPYGIPQGTPISATLSNLYMIDLDHTMVAACQARGALYQRYSDDLLLICKQEDESGLIAQFDAALAALRLKLNPDKTERTPFGPNAMGLFQYLGYEIRADGVHLRSSSLARQWRKVRRDIRRTRKAGEAAMAAGTASTVYTKRLRRRYSPIAFQNFSSYARKSAKVLRSDRIRRQVRRLERMADDEIRRLNT